MRAAPVQLPTASCSGNRVSSFESPATVDHPADTIVLWAASVFAIIEPTPNVYSEWDFLMAILHAAPASRKYEIACPSYTEAVSPSVL